MANKLMGGVCSFAAGWCITRAAMLPTFERYPMFAFGVLLIIFATAFLRRDW